MITLLVLCTVTNVSAGGKKKMEPLYDLSKTQKMEPYVYKLRLYNLFPVPMDNSVGTNDLHNAITILTFKKDSFETKEYFKDVFREMGGTITRIPPVSPSVIGFGQIRGFSLFDLRSNTFTDFRICPSIDESFVKIAIADARSRHFIFETEMLPKDSDDGGGAIYRLHLLDLSWKEPKTIKEQKLDPNVDWFVAQDKLFMYRGDIMRVYTTHLEPSHHPIQDFFARNRGKISAFDIHIHPTLPFAIVVDDDIPSFIVSWGKDRWGDKLVNLFGERVREPTFSPDGKWVVFQRRIPDRVSDYETYIAPVSEKYPYFIGTPIKLSEFNFEGTSGVWAVNPTSFVGAYSDELYRWELSTAAHPESTKPDFHEFIVERDLERLTKEKKQGLGKEKK